MRAISGSPYGYIVRSLKLCYDFYAVTTEKRDAEGVVTYIVKFTNKLIERD